MKKIFAILPATLLAANPAFAGPYLNVEANSGFSGNDYDSTVIENHVGFESGNWYVQGGPAFVSGDGVQSSLELSAKVGGNYAMSESLDLYGEVMFMTGDTNTYGTKAGLKWSF